MSPTLEGSGGHLVLKGAAWYLHCTVGTKYTHVSYKIYIYVITKPADEHVFVIAWNLLLEPSAFHILNLKPLFSRSSNVFIIPLIPMGLNKENASVEINSYGESFLYILKNKSILMFYLCNTCILSST